MGCSSSFIPTFALILLRICLHNVEAEIFNVYSFAAISDEEDSDITAALEEGWSLACQGSNDDKNTVLIPKGTFSLKAVTFSGPCNAPITFQVDGNVKAPAGASVGGAEQWVLFTDVQGLTISGTGTFDGLGDTAWGENNCKQDNDCDQLPTSIKLSRVSDAYIGGITSVNSKSAHIKISESKTVEINGVKIQAPAESPNTDGIDISRSDGVKVFNSDIGTGDDCIAIIRGTTNLHINNVNCGPGHGISIGSLGKYKDEGDVSGIVVENSRLSGTSNGLRIKTWASPYPSKVFDVTYREIVLDNVDNPIIIDQNYCPNSNCGSEGESAVEISDVKYENIKGTSDDEVAVIMNCSKANPCRDITLSGLDIKWKSQELTKASCSNFEGEFIGSNSPPRCG
ncbi:PREDICTED: exopolygalacturonase-like [Ipomoea nil]|uniref:exopolygalacturonase-like n=1 Tax=Ipomoea nil TaxID=35883 RepID=UPI000900F595|nr:PREDICTED: exopolygalacturonase-like [Ipomoea nil]